MVFAEEDFGFFQISVPIELRSEHGGGRGDGPPPVPPPGDPGWRWPQITPFTPTRAALCDRDSPQQPFFLPTPTNLFRSQATADDKTATDEGVLREGSLCSINDDVGLDDDVGLYLHADR